MATEEAVVTEAEEGGGEGERERSTIGFPWSDLDNSIRIAKGVHKIGGLNCQIEQLAAELKVAIKGGAFRLMLAAAKTFGMVNFGQGNVTLTPLGQQINDPQKEKVAKADAFLHVPLYRAVYERYKGGTLPPPQALETEMVNLGVAKKSADRVRQIFQKSAQQAGFFGYGSDRLVMPGAGPGASATPDQHKPSDEKPLSDRKDKGHDDGGSGRHQLIEGLIKTLPKEGSDWSIEDRLRWLQLAAGIFEFVYTQGGSANNKKIEVSAK